MTVGQQVLVTILTTVCTYALIFGLNYLLIREGRRKDRVARAAEQVKIRSTRLWDSYDNVLLKFGEANARLRMLQIRVGSQAFRNDASAEYRDELLDVHNAITVAIGMCSVVGYIVQHDQEPEVLETILTDRFAETMTGDITEHLEKLSEFISTSKVYLIHARDLELQASSLQHFYDGRVPKKQILKLKSFDSPLHNTNAGRLVDVKPKSAEQKNDYSEEIR